MRSEQFTRRLVCFSHDQSEGGTSKSGVKITWTIPWRDTGSRLEVPSRRLPIADVRDLRDWLTKWLDRHGSE